MTPFINNSVAADIEILANRYKLSEELGEIQNLGKTSDIFELVMERKENQTDSNIYDFNVQEHFAVRGQPATLEECEEARREELNKIDEGGFMSPKQRKQMNQTKTELDDVIIENKERSKYALKSFSKSSLLDSRPENKKTDEKPDEKTDENAEEKAEEQFEEQVENAISPYWTSPENILPSPESSVDDENQHEDAPMRLRKKVKPQVDSDSDSMLDMTFDEKKPRRDSLDAKIDEIWKRECPMTDPVSVTVPMVIDIRPPDLPKPSVSKPKKESVKELESYPANNNGNFILLFPV